MEVEGEVLIKDEEKNNDLFKGKDNVVMSCVVSSYENQFPT